MTDLVYLLTALTDAPALWTVMRRWARFRYRALAPRYNAHIRRTADYGRPLAAALDQVPAAPRRVLDVSTGTGFAAAAVAQRFPHSAITGCDLSPQMLARMRARLPGAAAVSCDSARLPFAAGMFDLVVLQNAPVPLPELVRVLAAGGWLVLAFSAGGRLPRRMAWATAQRLRRMGLDARWARAGAGLYLVARRTRAEAAA